MPAVKVTWFYEFEDVGWSYSLYQAGAVSLAGVLPKAQALGNLLTGLMTTDVELTYVRLSDDSVRGDSLVVSMALLASASNAGWSRTGSYVPPCARPAVAIESRFNSGTLHRKSFFISGVQTAQIKGETPWSPSPGWSNDYVSFTDELVASAWSFKGRNNAAPMFQVKGALPVILPNPGQWTLLFNGDPGFSIGQKIVITNASPKKIGLTGTYYVYSITLVGGITQVVIQGGSPPTNNLVQYLGGGIAQPLQSTFFQIDSTNLRRVTTRKRGRPFGQQAGRTPRRAITH